MAGRAFWSSARQYVLAGVLTIIPLWVTFLVFRFVFSLLVRWGGPFADALETGLRAAPYPLDWLLHPWTKNVLAITWTLVVLYMIGWVATRVVGHRIIAAIDSLMSRIPLAQTIYGSTKKLLAALQQKPDGVNRVVLIEFPNPEMRAVGFVTRTFRDEATGRELAAVYVPTTPNPTSGYLEIVPVDRIVSTTWSMDDAMSFIMSGGAVAPSAVAFDATRRDRAKR